MNEHKHRTIEIFNAVSEKGTLLLDKKINEGSYYRGYFFRDMVKNALPKGSFILDYGCGSGRIAKLIAWEGYKVIGIDPAEKLILEAKKQDFKDAEIEFEVLYDEGDALPNQIYDGIVCSSAIEFVFDPKKVLCNFSRSLKPDGKLFISFSNPNSWWRYYAKLRFGKHYSHFSVQRTSKNYGIIKRLLNECGFQTNGRPIYFESAFDDYSYLNHLNRLPFIGTLFFVTAELKRVGN